MRRLGPNHSDQRMHKLKRVTCSKCRWQHLQGPDVRVSHFSMISWESRYSLRAAWGPTTATVSTRTRTHTRTHEHGMEEWIRSKGQTPSHHGSNITATAVGLTSTSGPKPLLLA